MKKKIVEVDEDVLKDIIVGDIPVFGKDSPAPKEKSVEHQEAKSPAATVPAPRPERKVRGTSGSEKSRCNRTGRYSSGKARRGEAQKEKG